MIIDGNASVDTAGIQMRLRAAGSDATGSNYQRGVNIITSSTGPSRFYESTTFFGLGGVGNDTHAVEALIAKPQKAEVTSVIGLNVNGSGTFQLMVHGGNHLLTTAYDGFTLLVASGNFTGTVRVYGYKD
jgi:hypothetical protein